MNVYTSVDTKVDAKIDVHAEIYMNTDKKMCNKCLTYRGFRK